IPLACISLSSSCPIGPSSRRSAVAESWNRNGRSSAWMRGKKDSRKPVVCMARSTIPVVSPETILTSLPSWPPANTRILTDPPVRSSTSLPKCVAISCDGWMGVSGWASLSTTGCPAARAGRAPKLRTAAPALAAAAIPNPRVINFLRFKSFIFLLLRVGLRVEFSYADRGPSAPTSAPSRRLRLRFPAARLETKKCSRIVDQDALARFLVRRPIAEQVVEVGRVRHLALEHGMRPVAAPEETIRPRLYQRAREREQTWVGRSLVRLAVGARKLDPATPAAEEAQQRLERRLPD